MGDLSRRRFVGATLGAASSAVLARPHIANAAAKTATVWQTQGFIPQEDEAFKKLVADYESASGNKIDYSILPFLAQGQKTISALTSGDVPDLISYDAPETIVPQNAWDDKLLDVTDVIETQKSQLSPTALLCSYFFNNATKKRGYYLAPYKVAGIPIHIWGDLVEKAGFKLADAPKTWDGFWDFFKPVQTELRKHTRRVYGFGMQLTTIGPNDGNNVFTGFLIANGGVGIITPDGRQHTDDPKVRDAAIKAVTYMTDAYKGGFVPPEALSWNDADDNNAFHEKAIVMDFDGTISTELAVIANKQQYYHEMVTMGLPLGNDGKTIPAQVGAGGGFIPKGAKNVDVAKDFLKYLLQPQVMNTYLKNGLGRWLPAVTELVKTDPFWLDASDPHRPPYVRECLLGPTIPSFNGYNPAWGQVQADQLWGQAHAHVLKDGMTPSAAVDQAFKRIEQIFAAYPIAQS
ncbi:MAG: ABC transporter substrate-binding protein [Acetobacteraceae bacterium]